MEGYKERVAEAVRDPDWQRFRKSLKGQSTRAKLKALSLYMANVDGVRGGFWLRATRVDNYIKALCRGGQLYPGESLETMIRQGWNPRIKRG